MLWVERLWGNTSDVVTVNAVAKLLHLDTAVVMETFIVRTSEIIASQRELLEMTTPVAALWDEVLLLPIVGIIDSRRAQNMMNDVLKKIGDTQARVFVLDISGVAVVDTAVANHLIKITKATKLMGCDCIISGLSSAIAQTIVELGIDVGTVRTTATLKDAVRLAFSLVDVQIQRGS
jgi:rsbT co-antagonist protein RsbR